MLLKSGSHEASLPGVCVEKGTAQGATLNVNFKGKVINMSLTFETGLGFDVLLNDYKAALAASPKIQYWADDAHLYASYIWIDGDTEVEISRTLKGPTEGSRSRSTFRAWPEP